MRSLAELLTAIAFIVVVVVMFATCSPLAGGDLMFGYPHTVEGTIIAPPATRYVRSDKGGGQEKVSLTVGRIAGAVPANMADAGASVDGELIVECGSTRCTQLQVGDRVVLACRTNGRFFEPSTVECKHERTIEHTAVATPEGE